MATRTTGSGTGDPARPQGALSQDERSVGAADPQGHTQQLPLVDKPGAATEETGAESPHETGTGEALQETKPMPAVAWPPLHHPQDHPSPSSPPPLTRARRAERTAQIEQTGSHSQGATAAHNRPGVLTQELRRALPTWALPLLTSQPLSVWIGARIGITLLALLATLMLPAFPARGTANWYGSPAGPSLDPFIDSIAGVWTRWDGQWYLKIATEGYRLDDGSAAFFPLYPWLVTIFGWLAGERFIWAGMLLSSLFFLGALVLLHRLVRFDFHTEDAGRTVFYLAAFPMAFFFWAVYSESLFLLLSVGALLAMRAHRWWWAAACVGLAIWTRTTGLLLLLPMAWELWRAYHPPLPTSPNAMPPGRPSRWAIPSLLLPLGSVLLFMLWSWVTFRDPLAPLSAQAGWNRHFSWPWQTVAGAWNAATQTGWVFQPENQAWTYLASFAVAVVLGVLALRWLRPSYSIYLWAGIIFPLFSATRLNPLLSYPRFLAVLFPLFIVLALVGRNRYAHQIITWASLLLLALYTIRFVNWYWVA